MRLGGRVQQSGGDEDADHPVILPRESHLTALIIGNVHAVSSSLKTTFFLSD